MGVEERHHSTVRRHSRTRLRAGLTELPIMPGMARPGELLNRRALDHALLERQLVA
jgi:hypothetical protein